MKTETKQQMREAIIKCLQGSDDSLQRKRIIALVHDEFPKEAKKKVKKAFAALEEEGQIVQSEDSKLYHCAAKKTQSTPIAQIIRSRSKEESLKTSANKGQIAPLEKPSTDVADDDDYDEDIDEEIRRLEEELNQESDDESSSDESEEVVQSTSGDALVSMSKLAEERIAPLPTSCLPYSKRRALKGIDSGSAEQSRKRSRRTTAIDEGLKAAVKSVLDGYVARSSEKLPFYCRVCAKQSKDEKEFLLHKRTDFHKAAVEMEKKASYCKLCRKQLTSPVQLKEHLKSKPHKDRLRSVQSRQQRQHRP